MILIKTNLKKIPEFCNMCKLVTYDKDDFVCSVKNKVCKRTKKANKFYRPNWCPLVLTNYKLCDIIREKEDV